MCKRYLFLGAILLLPFLAQAETTKSTLFTNVMVWDGTSETLIDADVVVTGNLISEVSTEALAGIASTDMQIIDGGGRTLMPGLIDSHVHLTHQHIPGGVAAFEATPWDEIGAWATVAARELLMNGFTTVRDMGGTRPGIRKLIDANVIPGPRLYAAGAYITQTAGHADLRLPSQPNAQQHKIMYSNIERLGLIRIADGVPNILTAVRENFADGAVYIKIHAGGGVSSEKDPLHVVQYTPEELAAAGQAVRNWDTYFTVHAYNTPSVNQALDGGAMCIDHGQLIDEKTMRRLERDEIFLVSNLNSMSPLVTQHPNYSDPNTPVGRKTLEFLDGSSEFVGLINEHKPKWVFGSDVVFTPPAAFRMLLDNEKYIAGEWFGNLYALQGMTSRAGELAALTGKTNPYPEAKLGVIEAGAYADILLVDGNPLEDLAAIGAREGSFDAPRDDADIESIRLIMKDGKIYKNTL